MFFLLYKTKRFHAAVLLFSNRSQRTSKCGKNISDTLGYRFVCHFLNEWEREALKRSFLRGLRYANVSLTHSGVDTLRN